MPVVPEGIGGLFTGSTRRKFAWSLVGTVLAAFADAIGVIAVLPLLRVLTTGERNSVAEWVYQHTGHPSTGQLVGYLSLLIFGAFLLKGVLTVSFRWWMLGFIYLQESGSRAQ